MLTPASQHLSPSPAVQQSGKGGTFVLPTTNITEGGAEFGSVPAGAPYFGQDSSNGDLCESNGRNTQGLWSDALNFVFSLFQRDARCLGETTYLRVQ